MVHSLGLIIWFDNMKGFGMLETPDSSTVFIHIKSFKNRPEQLLEKQIVVYTPHTDAKRQRTEATQSRLLTDTKDWQLVMHYLHKPDHVFLRDHHRHKEKQPDSQHLPEPKSLLHLCFVQLASLHPENDILDMIMGHFDHKLKDSSFLRYCEFLENSISSYFGTDKATSWLFTLFEYFGAKLNADILFDVWQAKKFRYIGYNDAMDYEIPEEVLARFMSRISQDDLERIMQYGCAPAFFRQYLPSRLDGTQPPTDKEIRLLHDALNVLDDGEQQHWTSQLEKLTQI